jgi:hypothetical protein
MGGERGIRTPGTLLKYTRFPGVPVKPLLHLSIEITDFIKIEAQNTKKNFRIFFCQEISPLNELFNNSTIFSRES